MTQNLKKTIYVAPAYKKIFSQNVEVLFDFMFSTQNIDLFDEFALTWTSGYALVIKSELGSTVELKLHKTKPWREPLHIPNQ